MKKLSLLLALLIGASLHGVILVNSNITTSTTWGDDASEDVIILDGPIFVKGGATLTINPGVIVRGQPRRGVGSAVGTAPGSLIVTRDGRLVAEGTNATFVARAAGPIVFTSAVLNDGNGAPATSGAYYTGWTSGTTLSFLDDDPIDDPLPLLNARLVATDTEKPFSNTELDDGTSATAQAYKAQDHTEMWGGLIILGSAPTNRSLSVTTTTTAEDGTESSTTTNYLGVTNIEGLTASEDTRYGGTIVNDDSGSLKYVSVRHGGDQIGTGNEINGITLGGVGAGTEISYCEVYCSFDDGFEWFGGTVNGDHLMVTAVGDDSFDGDQGWSGSVQYAFTVQADRAVGITGGDEACEFDGDDASKSSVTVDGDTYPDASYQFANMTIIGPDSSSSTTAGGDYNGANGRITLRDGYAGALYNVYMQNGEYTSASDNGGSAFDIKSSAHGPITLDTVTMYGYSTTALSTTGSYTLTTANVASQASASSVQGLKGADINSENGVDPRPKTGTFSSQATGIASTVSLPASFADSKGDSPTYVGAFPTSASLTLWTTGWTALNASDILVD